MVVECDGEVAMNQDVTMQYTSDFHRKCYMDM